MIGNTKYRLATFTVLAFLLASCTKSERRGSHSITMKAPPVISVALNGDKFLWLVTGEAGEIVRTSDGGETWSRSAPPPGERFSQISFIDAAKGWTVADQSKIYHTTDSGASWFEIARLSYDDGFAEHAFEDIEFIDESRGWVVDPMSVWRTEDGGHNWSQNQPEPSGDGWTDQLSRTYFINSDTGWATGTGGGCSFTTDGGRSWARKLRVCEHDLSDLFFLDEAIGWTACGTSGIFGTENGGNDWFKAHLPEVGVTNPEEKILVRTLSITSRYEGWAAGAVEWYDTDSEFHSRGILLHTTDGGRNWLEAPVASEEHIYNEVKFGDSSTGWLFGGSGKIYRTIDDGRSWMSILTLQVDRR